MRRKEVWITVKEFAKAAKLRPGQIYHLLRTGLPHRRNPSPKKQGKIFIPKHKGLAWLEEERTKAAIRTAIARSKAGKLSRFEEGTVFLTRRALRDVLGVTRQCILNWEKAGLKGCELLDGKGEIRIYPAREILRFLVERRGKQAEFLVRKLVAQGEEKNER